MNLQTTTARSAPTRWRAVLLVLTFALTGGLFLLFTGRAMAQQYDSSLYSSLQWRLIGPFRAGRVTAVAGIQGQPAVYYIGTPGGGVWKTTDGGRVWKPIFDEARVASIGALALAPSDPRTIYVGTGEQTEGNGVYKSIDGGATWKNIGLRETHYISSIIVDPRDPNMVLVGALGDATPGEARGVFRTTDGGATWNRVFFKDTRAGVADMCVDPENPRVVYIATVIRQFDRREAPPSGPGAELFKSVDGGATWKHLSETGLPANARGRAGVAVAPGNGGRRVYAIMNQGFFRSDDGGETWSQSTRDPRVIGSGYFSRIFVDPRNADRLYVMQTSMYRSTDGGRTFEAYKGAPSGEDQHVLWIDPDNSERMILGSDQGAIISLNGGHTWTSWFNQPTGQFYHVITDNGFPYRAYAAQQDSGSVAVLSRSDFGLITYRDWFSTGAFESGYIAPDPANQRFVYSVGWYGSVLRMDRDTGQIATVFVPGPKYRYTWATPLVFSAAEPGALYLGMQHALRTIDNAMTWREISPDLTEKPGVTATATPERGVIEAIAPSRLRAGEIWVGTSTGLIQVTRDGGATWQNVTPRELPANASVPLIEPSALDGGAAYAIASVRNDRRPYIYRTQDGGKTWLRVVAGLPDRGIANVVREDPVQRSLVYAGTEQGVYVSFDGGDHWQSLQLNLPVASVTDLAVHGNDLVASTFGRALWILDDVSPLRELDSKTGRENVTFFKPQNTIRVRWDNWPDTPLPADTPAGRNPPDGAIFDYYLKSAPARAFAMEIRDEKGNTVQRFSSVAQPDPLVANVPDYWLAPPTALPGKAGMNRFVWNLRLPHPQTLPYGFYGRLLDYVEFTLPDDAVPGETPRHQPQGPFVAPGRYEAVLTVDGKTYRQQFTVGIDPRVRASQADLDSQFALAKAISDWMGASYGSYQQVAAVRAVLAERMKSLAGLAEAKSAFDRARAADTELAELQEGTSAVPGFGSLNRDLARYITMIESGDLRPPESARQAALGACEALGKDADQWGKVNADTLPALNRLLETHKLAALPIAAPPPKITCTVAENP